MVFSPAQASRTELALLFRGKFQQQQKEQQ